jgi:hypothetical protein
VLEGSYNQLSIDDVTLLRFSGYLWHQSGAEGWFCDFWEKEIFWLPVVGAHLCAMIFVAAG